MSWKNVKLIFLREVRDQLRDRRTLFMITILPVLLYPMLGLGMVEMMLTFSEQKRTVVILNADELPEAPAFLDENGIAEQWFSGGAEDSARLQIIADNQKHELPAAGDQRHRRRKTPAELLLNGQQVAARLGELAKTDPASLSKEEKREREDQLTALFAGSGIQVLVMVPNGYADGIARLRNQTSLSDGENASDPPALRIVRNSADDKSSVASGRVETALLAWETALRRQIFEHAELRSELFHPAAIKPVEMARGEELAANVWSKLFPAMIVIMALTGAFYPAIDLGAGEKERGTMETLLISPARRVELVLGKFGTILMFSIGTAVMNLLSMGLTGSHMASTIGATMNNVVGLEFPGMTALVWLAILLIPLASLFSALCLALATFAKSTKEGQYYLTPLLMVIMGLTMFSLSPAVEITPLYSVIPVINISLLLKGLLLSQSPGGELLAYAVPVLISSFGYSVMALWWAIDLYNSEGVLFRAADKFSVRGWLSSLTRDKEPVPAPVEAGFCFVIILLLQFIAMSYMRPDLSGTDREAGLAVMRATVIQQLTMIACPALFMGIMLTTSLRATFRLRKPTLSAIGMGIALAFLVHPLSIELSSMMVERGILPPPPMEGISRINELLRSADLSPWLLVTVFAVTPAICEEIAFRGFILSGLAKGGRLGIAIIASSFMFGIVHMIPQQAFNAALLGLLLSLLAVHSRSLFPAIAFHLCNNTIASLHARNGFGIKPDGVFFTSVDGMLRYQAPLLLLCGLAVGVLASRMVRDLRDEQERKRATRLESFDAPGVPVPVVVEAGLEHAQA